MSRVNGEETEYRVFNVKVVTQNDEKVLIESERTGRSEWVPHETVTWLYSCNSFHTIEDHVRHIARISLMRSAGKRGGFRSWFSMLGNRVGGRWGSANGGDHVVHELQWLAEEGYLVSRADLSSDLLSRIKQNPAHPGRTAEISAIGIPTCDRPQTLKRTLDSFLNHFAPHGRTPDIWILDDSRQEDSLKINREILRGMQNRYEGSFNSMNREQRQAFGEFVASKSGVSPEILQFALMGHLSCNRSEGGCRNAFLLLTRGEGVMMTDDDTFARPAKLPDIRHGVKLVSALSSDDYWFFKSFEEAVEEAQFEEVDFLSLHEAYLGKSVAELISGLMEKDSEAGVDIDGLKPTFFGGLETGRAAIYMTHPGPVGDTCLYNDLYRLFLEGGSLDRLLDPSEEFSWHMATRQVIRGVVQPVISDLPRCIGMNFAADNRFFLPPFMPVQARCDGIFGDLLALCFPEAFSANIPWVIPHNPPEPRTRTLDDIFALLEGIRVNDLLSAIIYAIKSRMEGKTPQENLRIMGEFFMSLTAKPKAAVEAEIREIYTSTTEQQIRMVDELLLLQQQDLPIWRQHMRKYQQGMKAALGKTDFLLPLDIDNPTSDKKEDFLNILSLFGQLLYNWHKIIYTMEQVPREELKPYITRLKI